VSWSDRREGSRLTVRARAKVNLGLEILGRRPDGYHEVVTILQQIDLADTLHLAPADDLRLTCDRPDLATEANLVLRAARAFRDATGTRRGVALHLEKHIPIAAGLGGGSADAAATLVALNDWWGIGWSAAQLERLAGRLGADIAFFVRGGTQLATGIGDRLEPLPTPAVWLVLLPQSAAGEKTSRLYAAVRSEDWSDGTVVHGLAAALRSGAATVAGPLPSGFRRAAAAHFPEMLAAAAAFAASGGRPGWCGAGPSLISVHPTRAEAERVAAALRSRGYPALAVPAVPSSPSGTGDWAPAP
jgi:4-diphosphocytidyl-2-C-methyl-D-erythritol kinase